MNPEQKSTYALLVHSEEKSRSIMETVLYAMCIVSGIVAIWQFIDQSSRLSLGSPAPREHSAPMASQHVMQVDLLTKS